MQFNTSGEICATLLSIIILFLCTIYPLLIYILMKKFHLIRSDSIKESIFRRRLGTLFESIDIQDLTSLEYNVYFTTRRLFFSILTVIPTTYAVFQI